MPWLIFFDELQYESCSRFIINIMEPLLQAYTVCHVVSRIIVFQKRLKVNTFTGKVSSSWRCSWAVCHWRADCMDGPHNCSHSQDQTDCWLQVSIKFICLFAFFVLFFSQINFFIFFCSQDSQELFDAELAARVLQLINITDTGVHAQVSWKLFFTWHELRVA